MEEEREPLYRRWAIALGIPSLVFGTGFVMMMSTSFWLGVVIAYFGAGWFLIDWGLVSYKEHTLKRVVVGFFPTALAALITWVAFRPAPLAIDIYPVDANYEEGSVVAGIKWKSRYSDIRVSLGNGSSTSYTNIEITLRTDQMIAGVGSTNPISQCQSAPDTPNFRVGGVTLTFPTKEGKSSIPVMFTGATQYKVICDRIIGGENLELLVAVEPNIIVGQKWEKHDPAWFVMNTEYDAFIRPNGPIRKAKCFLDKCYDVQGIVE
jgi:hypothetical protein